MLHGGKLLGGIKSMYADSLVCVKVKWGGSEQFRIDSVVRQGSIMSLWLFKGAVMKKLKMGLGRMGVRSLEEMNRDSLASCMQMT